MIAGALAPVALAASHSVLTPATARHFLTTPPAVLAVCVLLLAALLNTSATLLSFTIPPA